jgi:hypothetical protein
LKRAVEARISGADDPFTHCCRQDDNLKMVEKKVLLVNSGQDMSVLQFLV